MQGVFAEGSATRRREGGKVRVLLKHGTHGSARKQRKREQGFAGNTVRLCIFAFLQRVIEPLSERVIEWWVGEMERGIKVVQVIQVCEDCAPAGAKNASDPPIVDMAVVGLG